MPNYYYYYDNVDNLSDSLIVIEVYSGIMNIHIDSHR